MLIQAARTWKREKNPSSLFHVDFPHKNSLSVSNLKASNSRNMHWVLSDAKAAAGVADHQCRALVLFSALSSSGAQIPQAIPKMLQILSAMPRRAMPNSWYKLCLHIYYTNPSEDRGVFSWVFALCYVNSQHSAQPKTCFLQLKLIAGIFFFFFIKKIPNNFSH